MNSSAKNRVQQVSSTKNRIHWIDYAKGIGIFLVVLGHVCRGLVDSELIDGASPTVQFIDQWIYAFHMPLFFFVSGLLIHSAAAKPWQIFWVDKARTIVYPYLLWATIQSVLMSFASSYTNASASLGDLWRIIYEPVFIFWFLYVLLVIMVLYKLVAQFDPEPFYFLMISVGLYFIHLAGISDVAWTIPDLVCRYAIYFGIGAIVSKSSLLPIINQAKLIPLITMVLGGFLTIAVFVWLQLATNELLIPLLGLIGTSASVAFAILLERFKLINFIKLWGLLSLQIYVVHTIATSGTRMVLQKLLGIHDPFTHVFLGTIAGIYLPIVLHLFTQQIGFQYLFTLQPKKA
jgi:fucose 4-O-acetylase-like acetyltransferase